MTIVSLPPEKRRNAKERLIDILADPRASTCSDDCYICSKFTVETTEAALFMWDEIVRSGIWPIKRGMIHQRLLESNLARGKWESRNRLEKFLYHRRGSILFELVKQDKEKWGVPASSALHT